jgi:uncharacterized protein YkwD
MATTRKKARPQLEQLEDRTLLAGNISLNPATGVLTIRGTAAADRATVSVTATQVSVTISGGARGSATFAASQVQSILFLGNAGNDRFLNYSNVAAWVFGGGGRDYFQGGGGDDYLDGSAGNDTLVGGAGNDVLRGWAGDDQLYGQDGNDQLFGGTGRNLLDGGTGADYYFSESSLDTVPAGVGGTSVDGVNLTAAQALLVQRTNAYRAANGLPALRVNLLLMQDAQGHADNMARQDRYGDSDTNGHILDGHDYFYRLNAVGYRYTWMGENVAYNFGYDNPAATLMDQWWNSAGHRENILNPKFTEIGVGVARGASGRTYGVQVFAQPA